jgi:RNA polymerase sigma-70 factor (ECF subfamily)
LAAEQEVPVMALDSNERDDRERERALVTRAQAGDHDAFGLLVEPLRRPLLAYILRMVARREEAEDLLQDTFVRALKGIADFQGNARFKSWIFTIATNLSLDHLRDRKRWRVETQLDAEISASADADVVERIRGVMADPAFLFEIREHVAYCFSCVARTLEPEEQAALLLREVFGFSAEEAAGVMHVSQPVFGHRLRTARQTMASAFENLCALVGKQGVCWQCRKLREFAPEARRGPDLILIQGGPCLAASPDTLLDARLAIVRDADLEHGRTRSLHDWFFRATADLAEEGRPFR